MWIYLYLKERQSWAMGLLYVGRGPPSSNGDLFHFPTEIPINLYIFASATRTGPQPIEIYIFYLHNIS